MSYLRDRIPVIAATELSFGQPPSPRISAAVNDLCNKIAGADHDFGKSSVEDIQKQFWSLFENGQLALATRQQCKRFLLTAWLKPLPIVANEIAWRALLARIEVLNRKSLFRIAASAFLRHFSSEDIAIPPLREMLLKETGRLGIWSNIQESFRVFDDGANFDRFSQYLLDSDHTAIEELQSLGFRGDLVVEGVTKHLFESACLQTAKHSGSSAIPYIKKLLIWANQEGHFAYPDCKVSYCKSLLDPWNNNSPDPDLKSEIKDSVFMLLGDPRLHRARWSNVPERTKQVLLKWLVEDSVELFLEVIDQTAERHMWSFRKRFWRQYLKNGHIDEAWPILGGQSRHLARVRAAQMRDNSLKNFGELSGASSSQSVLLMRIGRLTIAEWSHSGKWRLWEDGVNFIGTNPEPKLYQKYYDATDLRDGHEEESHTGSERFSWQRRLAQDFIEPKTGIRINFRGR